MKKNNYKLNILFMKKFIVFFIFLSYFTIFYQNYTYAENLYYTIPLEKEINSTTWQYVNNGLKNAEKLDAEAVIIKMNTFGGALDYADSIRTSIMNYNSPVFCFINKNAASAGALIAIACDSIYMSNGATIGSATVVDGNGNVLPDKYQSYMRAIMRATAESHGKKRINDTMVWKRNPIIAEAMVDPRISANIAKDDTLKVLAFTTDEAIEYGYCEGYANSIDDIIRTKLNDNKYEIRTYEASFTDELIGFLTNPAVQAILIMIIIGGIYFELQSPGLGFPSAAAITAAILYFLPLYLAGSAESWEIIVFVIGLIFLIFEIFVIPGFGFVGITGILLILSSLILSIVNNSLLSMINVENSEMLIAIATVIGGSLLALILIIYLSNKLGSRKGIFKNTSLDKEQKIEDGYIGVPQELKSLIGREGTATTDMRPGGKITVDESIYDAVSMTGFITQGTIVKVIKYENSQLYVK